MNQVEIHYWTWPEMETLYTLGHQAIKTKQINTRTHRLSLLCLFLDKRNETLHKSSLTVLSSTRSCNFLMLAHYISPKAQ
jgi:hypothetical protein